MPPSRSTHIVVGLAALLMLGAELTTRLCAAHAPEAPAKLTAWSKTLSTRSTTGSVRESVVVAGLRFFPTVDLGLVQSQQTDKPLLVYMKKEGCRHCAAFESSILREGEVQTFLASNFSLARVLAGSKDALRLERDFGCYAYPHFVVFNASGSLTGRWYGQPQSARAFIAKITEVLSLVAGTTGDGSPGSRK